MKKNYNRTLGVALVLLAICLGLTVVGRTDFGTYLTAWMGGVIIATGAYCITGAFK